MTKTSKSNNIEQSYWIIVYITVSGGCGDRASPGDLPGGDAPVKCWTWSVQTAMPGRGRTKILKYRVISFIRDIYFSCPIVSTFSTQYRSFATMLCTNNTMTLRTGQIQLSAVITLSSITWYCIHYCSDRGRMINQRLNLQRHTIARPNERGMVCLWREFWRKLTTF